LDQRQSFVFEQVRIRLIASTGLPHASSRMSSTQLWRSVESTPFVHSPNRESTSVFILSMHTSIVPYVLPGPMLLHCVSCAQRAMVIFCEATSLVTTPAPVVVVVEVPEVSRQPSSKTA